MLEAACCPTFTVHCLKRGLLGQASWRAALALRECRRAAAVCLPVSRGTADVLTRSSACPGTPRKCPPANAARARRRVLRKLQAAGAVRFERLRADIADFDPAGAPLLRRAPGDPAPGLKPWVAFGKHLCGAAADLALRCAARHGAGPAPQACAPAGGRPAGDARAGGCTAAADLPACARAAGDSAGTRRAAAGGAPPPAGAAAGARAAGAGARAGGGAAGGGLLGLAVATCCHHRCTWRDYVGKGYLLRAGFSPEEFEIVSWMCGWCAPRLRRPAPGRLLAACSLPGAAPQPMRRTGGGPPRLLGLAPCHVHRFKGCHRLVELLQRHAWRDHSCGAYLSSVGQDC